MPQFDFANVFVPQIAWLALFFAILYFGVVRLTLPKVGKVMQAREDQVTGDLDTAEQAKASADRLAADYDAGVAAAQESARASLAASRAKSAAAIEKKLAKANEKLGAQADAAEAELSAARARALGEIEGVAADAAADIVEKLTGKRPAGTQAVSAARSALA